MEEGAADRATTKRRSGECGGVEVEKKPTMGAGETRSDRVVERWKGERERERRWRWRRRRLGREGKERRWRTDGRWRMREVTFPEK